MMIMSTNILNKDNVVEKLYRHFFGPVQNFYDDFKNRHVDLKNGTIFSSEFSRKTSTNMS
jgi:hypothetical protein